MQKACRSQLSAGPSCSDPAAVTHQTALCAACRAPTNALTAREGACPVVCLDPVQNEGFGFCLCDDLLLVTSRGMYSSVTSPKMCWKGALQCQRLGKQELVQQMAAPVCPTTCVLEAHLCMVTSFCSLWQSAPWSFSSSVCTANTRVMKAVVCTCTS